MTLPGDSGGSRAVDAPSPLEDQTGISSSLTVSPSTVVGGSESVVTVTLEIRREYGHCCRSGGLEGGTAFDLLRHPRNEPKAFHRHVRLQRLPEFRLEFLRCRHRLLRLTVSRFRGVGALYSLTC